MAEKVTVGIVQAGPVFMDAEASLEKALTLIGQAAAQGAQIIAFGETWLPGYPAWLDYCPDAALWNHEPTKQVFARLRRNSVAVPGPLAQRLSETAKRLQVHLVIGVNERVESGPGNGTLYNSLLTFGTDGALLNHHRKLVPTYTERMVWGPGDGHGLKVAETTAGRVGGLICWEHWMPLARQALHVAGEDFHVAVYPTVHEMHQIASRQYAFEGRCFVLAVGLVMRAGELPAELAAPPNLSPDAFVLRGGSGIIAPDGSWVVAPVFDEERIITAELDLTHIDREQMTLDVTGHYARPDVFDFSLRKPFTAPRTAD
jgi:predicted amidohydrolase